MCQRSLTLGAGIAAVACLLVCLAAVPAAGQAEYGIRAGVSGSPDQFFFGGHVETSPVVDRVRFRPNVEVGVGDDLTLVAINLEFVYRFALRARGWDAYVGGGPAANYLNHAKRHALDSSVEPGVTLVAGAAHRGGLFVELKLGLIDSPSLKLAVGLAWR